MKNRLSELIKKNILESNDLIFYITSVLFAAILMLSQVAGDDLDTIKNLEVNGIIGAWKVEWGHWFTWSSRLFVNFICLCMIKAPRWVWFVYLFISMFILLKALSLIFVRENVKYNNLFIAFIVMIMPWVQISTAGWIATTATYFGPLAFGILGMVPISKYYRSEPISKIEKGIYAVALIYGTNEEQMMAVAMCCYTVALVYFILKKKKPVYLLVMYLFVLMELANTFFCPGNSNRRIGEMSEWFPTYPMFDSIDKVDIGLFFTLKSVLIDNSLLFVIIILLLLGYFVYEQNSDIVIRCISFFPGILLILFGPLRHVLTACFYDLNYLFAAMSEDGLVTVDNAMDILPFAQYIIMMLVGGACLLALLFVSRRIESLLASYSILISGIASRCAIALSPTVHASGIRTYELLYLCIVMVGVLLFTENNDLWMIDAKRVEISKYVMIIGMVIAFLSLLMLTGVRFLYY